MAITYPVSVTFNTDKRSLKKVEKEVDKSAKGKGIGIGGIAGGVAIGNILSNLLSGLESIQKLLEVIGGVLNAFISPFIPILLTLMKPFFAIFLMLGGLLAKFLKNYLMNRGQGMVTKDEKGTPKLGLEGASIVALVGGAIAGILAIVVAGFTGFPALLIATLVGLITPAFIDLVMWLGNFFGKISVKIYTFLDKFFGTDFIGALLTLGQGIVDIFKGLWDILVGLLSFDFSRVWEGLKLTLLGLWEVLKGVFLTAYNTLKLVLFAIWESLKFVFSKSFEGLKTFGNWIWDTLVSIFQSSLNVLRNFGSWLWDYIKGVIKKVASKFSFWKSKKVNDVIITPSGQTIETNPRDYIIATKNPGSIGGTGKIDITINVNGNADNSTINEIVRRLQQELRLRGNY